VQREGNCFFFVRRTSFFIFFPKDCWVKECSGGLGVRGKVLVRDRLGVIAPVTATAAPPLVTAAVPRELRIDPCEKKKGHEFARWRERVPPGLRAGRYHWHGVSIAYLLLRERRGEVREKIGLRVGDAP